MRVKKINKEILDLNWAKGFRPFNPDVFFELASFADLSDELNLPECIAFRTSPYFMFSTLDYQDLTARLRWDEMNCKRVSVGNISAKLLYNAYTDAPHHYSVFCGAQELHYQLLKTPTWAILETWELTHKKRHDNRKYVCILQTNASLSFMVSQWRFNRDLKPHDLNGIIHPDKQKLIEDGLYYQLFAEDYQDDLEDYYNSLY